MAQPAHKERDGPNKFRIRQFLPVPTIIGTQVPIIGSSSSMSIEKAERPEPPIR